MNPPEQYVAITNLPVAVYQITYQLKILTTSLFSVLFFNRRYSAAKWFSLVLLTCGVAIVQLPDNSSSAAGQSKVSATPSAGNATVGVLAIFAACISSGIAGCYFE
jgi:UDP-sugar transporter A1/2/3